MEMIRETTDTGEEIYKLVQRFSVGLVEEQERAIMAVVNDITGEHGFTISKTKLLDLLDRDEAKSMKFGVDSRCPRCDKRVKPGLPEYRGLREFHCIECGQKLKRY